jgi:hypothetical protein
MSFVFFLVILLRNRIFWFTGFVILSLMSIACS